MARSIDKLSARAVATLKEPGRHSDGGGLYLVVDPSGAKRWLFMFRWQGKLKEMGLGGVTSVSLAKARERATAARAQVADGINPINARKAEGANFGAVADALLTDIEGQWRNEKHRAQWRMTLTTYAAPLREKRVDAITTDDVLVVLKPLWTAKPETASRLRARIERVLDAARAKGLRSGENPARWRGHLDHLLPKRQKLRRGHHAALSFDALADFMDDLRKRPAMAARALEFTILTASRSGEVLGARWSEVDLEAAVWTVPAERMKGAREHRVPLCGPTLELLRPLHELRESDHVFPGQKCGKPLSGMSMEMLLRRMERPVTVHGFRSTFRDWVGEETEFKREVAEAALAHIVGDATERAYRRGDALEKRRTLMKAWAVACGYDVAELPTGDIEAAREDGLSEASAGAHPAEPQTAPTPSPPPAQP